MPMNTSEQGRSNRPLAGIAWMVGGMFMLSVMDTLSKHAVEHLSTPVLVAIRSAMVLLLVLPWVARAGGLAALRTRRPLAHLMRGILSVCSLITFFESLRLLPLATVVAICFAAPLFMTLMSVVLLREQVGWQRWTALAAGFAGVSVIIGPQAMDGELGRGAWMALAAALFYAASTTSVRWLAATESDLSMIVSQNLCMLVAGLVGLAFVPLEPPGVRMGLVIFASAALLLLGQRMTFRALRLAPVGAVAPFHYTELVWATLFGWLFWREWPAAHVWWGAALVVGAGLYAIWQERRRAAET
jgi:drug/metabolite transporter (DMT)-like permease